MNVVAYNPSIDDLEKTFLSNSTAIAATTFKVKNTDRFSNGQKILIGEMGRDRSEILTISAMTATQFTLSAAAFPHDADDPIYALEFDKVRFYRSTTGENGTYSILATVDIDVDNANKKTFYNDINALPTYWYHVTYFDSVNSEETVPSANIQATGYEENSLGAAILEVVDEVDDKGFILFEISTLIGICNDISKDLLRAAKRPYRFLKRSTSLNALQGLDYVVWPIDLWKINYIEVNQQNPGSVETYRPPKVTPTDMRFRRSQTPLNSDLVYEVAYDDEAKRLLYNPAARVDRIGAFNMHYYKRFTRFTELSDLLETPDSLVYKLGMFRKYYLRKMDDDAKYKAQFMEYDKSYQAEIMKLQREKNVDAGGPDGMAPDRKRYRQWTGGMRRYRQ